MRSERHLAETYDCPTVFVGESRIYRSLVTASQVKEVTDNWIASRSGRIGKLARASLKAPIQGRYDDDTRYCYECYKRNHWKLLDAETARDCLYIPHC